jgi:hypothetical protein
MTQHTLRGTARFALAAALALAACDDTTRPDEICDNHADDDRNLLTDCDDPACRDSPSCVHDADADADVDTDADADAEADAEADEEADSDAGSDADGEVEGIRCDLATGETVHESPVYDGTVCVPPTQPLWSQLYWEAVTPEGTSIELGVRTAEREADLASAAEVAVATAPPDLSPADLEAALLAAGQENGHRFLQVIARLRCAGAAAPSILVSDNVLFYCE